MTTAINHALSVLGWLELPDDDRPPERIWLDDEELSAHFEKVHERYRGSRSDSSSEWEAVPDLEQNELTASFRR